MNPFSPANSFLRSNFPMSTSINTTLNYFYFEDVCFTEIELMFHQFGFVGLEWLAGRCVAVDVVFFGWVWRFRARRCDCIA
jgi:hypothetical protein